LVAAPAAGVAVPAVGVTAPAATVAAPVAGVTAPAEVPALLTTYLLGQPSAATVRGFALTVIEGPAQGARFVARTGRATVGAHPGNDLVVGDTAVSRFHCELQADHDSVMIRDLASSNGTRIDGVRIRVAFARDGSVIELGESRIQLELSQAVIEPPASPRWRFGSLLGRSVAMRRAFAALEAVAPTDVTVLLEGETGTGKEEAAISLHQASARAAGPFVVVDCGALPGGVLESELFGHERGAFTGAHERRHGAFEAAAGGTVFLDEIGELPLELQPKLLRVLERRTIRRLGSNHHEPVDVRVIAATHRDLRLEVNAGRFRSDLYYRLAVVPVRLPPLRERPEDVELVATHLVDQMTMRDDVRAALLAPAAVAAMRAGAWPGNVRELRNHLERAGVFHRAPAAASAATGPAEPPSVDASVSFGEARGHVLHDFERRYLEDLFARHPSSVNDAAAAAGISRVQLWRLARRHDIDRG
jgi:transcriptional regulator with GAF, ATPase, and Fis domain